MSDEIDSDGPSINEYDTWHFPIKFSGDEYNQIIALLNTKSENKKYEAGRSISPGQLIGGAAEQYSIHCLNGLYTWKIKSKSSADIIELGFEMDEASGLNKKKTFNHQIKSWRNHENSKWFGRIPLESVAYMFEDLTDWVWLYEWPPFGEDITPEQWFEHDGPTLHNVIRMERKYGKVRGRLARLKRSKVKPESIEYAKEWAATNGFEIGSLQKEKDGEIITVAVVIVIGEND